mmetsp:Transcript_3684/g.6358  ORF Transcript_3684/g.6358 Transcript_3684/m.6358 type:complete len:1326 (+) Transcript_3684:118-4095(+)
MSSSYYDDDSDEEEEECRVCRGPAEEGRPLFKPCKCSGSIGLTHQDCLTSWLDVTRGDGKCELCSTRFRFAPQYAEGTPDRLSAREVCFRILRRLAAKWLPRGLRAIFAAGLWLLVLPLLTAHIYHGWMRKVSAISERWTWELAKKDVVSGVVIAIIVVVSFLSLMSFAEFLRFEWAGPDQDGAAANNPGGGGRRRNRNRGNRGGGAVGADGERIPPPIEGEVDEIIRQDDGFRDSYQLESDDEMMDMDFSSHDSPTFQLGNDVLNDGEDVILNHLRGLVENGGRREDEPMAQPAEHGEVNGNADDDEIDEEDALEAFMRAQEEQDELEEQFDEEDNGGDEFPIPPFDDEEEDDEFPILPPRRPANPAPDARFEPQFEPLDPPFPDIPDADDPDAVDLNVALDELLGFRGPILALIRNLLWLLVFNTAYLGTFAFIPSFAGRAVYMVLSKFRFVHALAVSIPGVETLLNAVKSTIEELGKQSESMNMVYHPSEIAKIGLGYLGWAWGVFFLNSVIQFATRRREATNATQENGNLLQGREDGIPLLAQRREQLQREENNDENNAVKKRLIGLVESAAAIAKVVILLFIKMLFLPLSLGLCLDIATLELFQQSWNDRIAYAGKDLFGSVFLHWVVGITFMLLVTVSVLQLREVVHPDILARVIRPQEPQPDLLGNLLQETGTTHSKRILMSLGIYAALLGIHIWIPSRLLIFYNINQYLPIFQPKFWHILMPQIQVPLELFVFHLCMLGFLEKYKNNIGELQHHWLIFMGNILKMTDQMLPREVDEFFLLGTFPVFAKDASINNFDTSDDDKQAKVIDSLKDDMYPLWNDLLSEKDALKREDLIQSNISRLDPTRNSVNVGGELHRNGKLLLSSHTYIRFPSAVESPKLVFVKSSETDSNLLPTAIGPYRLKQRKVRKKNFIEVWREVPGKLIPRPPEGWDDLGVGGAERQGRWAWGDEQLSEIENSVATRTPFFDKDDNSRLSKSRTWIILMLKMTILLLVSWIAITVAVCTGINMPLYVGHYALGVLKVPPNCVHDPLAFAIGIGFIVPVIVLSAKLSNASNNGLKGVPALLLSWIRSFKPHQSREKMKTLLFSLVLWFGICPMLLGFLYRAFFLGVQSPWYGIDIYTDKHALLADWTTGTMLLNLWATVCYFRLFTIDFWVKMFTAEGQGNAGANRGGANANNPARNAQVQPANNGEDAGVWQGEDGIIGYSAKSIMAFANGWEWDKLDKNALLQDFSLPIFRHLATSCFVPWATAMLLSQADVDISSTILRLVIVATILIDYISSSKESLQRWFEAAHKIARDDRYLIGEILQNYTPRSVSRA